MKNIQDFITSGIIELYVFGLANAEEIKEVEQMYNAYAPIRDAVDALNIDIENNLLLNTIVPPPTIKPFLMAILDFMGRMQKGETPGFPPALGKGARISDYAEWLDRPDMIPPSYFQDTYAKIIGYTPELTTAIVWIKEMAPEEVHDNEYEKFLIVEGTCTITIEEEVHELVPGDYLAIPLYKSHHVQVTSAIPCKIILQRQAA